MSADDGFPEDMDLLALDAGTAERLVTGAVDVADAPPEYRAVARTLQALREAPDGSELAGMSDAVDRIAGAVVLERRADARRSRRSTKKVTRVAAACAIACGVALTGGLAAAGALPQSAQGVASAVLGRVGISVPTGDEKPADHQPPTSSAPPASPTTGSVTPAPAGDSPPPPSASGVGNPTPNDEGERPGTRSRGTPPSTAKGKGKGQAPDSPGATNPGNGLGNHP
jgi:hypothetical protein